MSYTDFVCQENVLCTVRMMFRRHADLEQYSLMTVIYAPGALLYTVRQDQLIHVYSGHC